MTKGYKECWYELGDIKGQALTLERITLKRAQSLAQQLSNILPWSDLALGEESLISHFKREDPALFRFSIHFGDELVGAASIREPWLKGPYLELLGLLPSVQRFGLGTELMNWFEYQAPETTRSLWLLCSDFNIDAYQFYQKQGFQKVCVIDNLYEEGFDDFLMRKRLK